MSKITNLRAGRTTPMLYAGIDYPKRYSPGINMEPLDTSDTDKWVGKPLGGGQLKEPITRTDIRRWAQDAKSQSALLRRQVRGQSPRRLSAVEIWKWRSGQPRSEIFQYIELFYNRSRRHSALGYLCPNQL
jgi:hypothetical protein